MGKFGETDGGGVGKSGVLEHKSGNISETRKVKIEEKLLWRAYRNLANYNALWNGTIPTGTPITSYFIVSICKHRKHPIRPPLLQDWGL